MRVLVVEDEERLATGIRAGLEAEGFAVDVAHTGTDGYALARTEPYDAIVLDIMLPGMNGLDVLKAIRSDNALSSLPVMVLTAKGQASDRRAAEAIGADAFVTKPFSNAEVVERVSRLAEGIVPR